MLVETRACESGRLTWSSSKIGIFCRDTAPFRMSNFSQPTSQPDWQEQYSVYGLQSAEGRQYHHQQEHQVRLNTSIAEDAHKVQQVIENRRDQEQRQGSSFLSSGNINLQPPRPEMTTASVEQHPSANLQHGTPSSITQSTPHPIATTSSDVQVKREGATESHEPTRLEARDMEEDELEDEIEDEDMIDPSDDGRPEPQTAAEKAERIAEKKKMKRFR